jgi:hypothetical protein
MTAQNDTQNMLVPDAPPIPGLTFRHWCGKSDYAHNPNHALDLYESAGYRVVRKWTVCRKPLE